MHSRPSSPRRNIEALRHRGLLFLLLAALVAIASAACNRAAPPAPAEPPTLDVTSWTDTSELFMEYPPLVAGQTVRFAVHLTKLADFGAINAGRPRIEMTPEAGGAATTLPGSEPLRPGAFREIGRASCRERV